MASFLIPERFSTFKRALKSFENQTMLAPVIISVCGPEAWRAKHWVGEIFGQKVQYELLLFEERMSQFDQLFTILNGRKERTDNLFVSVCDDDDWFSPDRIEVQESYLSEGKSCLKCLAQTDEGATCHSDFGAYCFKASVLEEFFRERKYEYAPSIAPDLLFTAGLSECLIPKVMHFKRISLWDRRYNEERDDGEKWFSFILRN